MRVHVRMAQRTAHAPLGVLQCTLPHACFAGSGWGWESRQLRTTPVRTPHHSTTLHLAPSSCESPDPILLCAWRRVSTPPTASTSSASPQRPSSWALRRTPRWAGLPRSPPASRRPKHPCWQPASAVCVGPSRAQGAPLPRSFVSGQEYLPMSCTCLKRSFPTEPWEVWPAALFCRPAPTASVPAPHAAA
jgi:hypothetical protein